MLVVLWLLFTFGALYLLIVRPQRRRYAAHQALVAALVEGDEVLTAGGIVGVVTGLDDDLVWIEVAPGTVIRVAKGAVARKLGPAPADDTGGDEPHDRDAAHDRDPEDG